MRMIAAWSMLFLSTPSARRATRPQHFQGHPTAISIHALCEEGDSMRWCRNSGMPRFLSTPSARRATRYGRFDLHIAIFLSTPSARRATHGREYVRHFRPNFYPRPLRGGRRAGPMERRNVARFLSTPSARRATASSFSTRYGLAYFYPRPLRGGRHPRGEYRR